MSMAVLIPSRLLKVVRSSRSRQARDYLIKGLICIQCFSIDASYGRYIQAWSFSYMLAIANNGHEASSSESLGSYLVHSKSGNKRISDAISSLGCGYSFNYGRNQIGDNVCEVGNQRKKIYRDPDGSLEVTAIAEYYADYNAVKWSLVFANPSYSVVSKKISNVNVIDAFISERNINSAEEVSLRYSLGAQSGGETDAMSIQNPSDFELRQYSLNIGDHFDLEPENGRSSSGIMPYIGIRAGRDIYMMAIGWSGHWRAVISRNANDAGIKIQAGQKYFDLQLRPREQLRSPSILVIKTRDKDWESAHNSFRKFMVDHIAPKNNDRKPPRSIIAASYEGKLFEQKRAKDLLDSIDYINNNGIAIDTFWHDAGWYPVIKQNKDSDLYAILRSYGIVWASGVGDWEPDKTRFPNGYKEVSDKAHRAGMKSLLWFEPERVALPSANYVIFKADKMLLDPIRFAGWEEKIFRTVNFSDRSTVDKVAALLIKRLKIMGVDYLRYDMNGPGPLETWLLNDKNQSVDMGGIARIGATEAGYVAGLYYLWDKLKSEYPNLIIDNCASGGRRLDIEALSRTYPLWRSDRVWDSVEQQNQMFGLSHWIPFQGRGSDGDASSADELRYKIRSGYGWFNLFAQNWGSSMSRDFLVVIKNEVDLLSGAKVIGRYRHGLAHVFTGDFYPLYAHKMNKNPSKIRQYDQTYMYTKNQPWIGWQFFLGKEQVGIIQAFRRGHDNNSTYTVRPKGLEKNRLYTIYDIDAKQKFKEFGSKLYVAGGRIVNIAHH